MEGIAAAVDPSKREARLAVAFPGNPFNRPPPPGGNYLVLGTDYTSFSIVWSCESLPGSDRSFSQFTALDYRDHWSNRVDGYQGFCGT